MGGHHNRVASSLSRRINNCFIGMLVFKLHHIAGHASCRGNILRRLEIFRGKSGSALFILVRRVRHHARLNRENMERLRHGYCGDFGIKSFCQSNAMVDGFLRQLGSVGRDQDMLVHLAPPSNFLTVRSRTTADHRSMRRYSRETVAISIVFGALTDPGTNGISVADRQLLLALRPAHLWGGAPIEEPHQVTAFRITRVSRLLSSFVFSCAVFQDRFKASMRAMGHHTIAISGGGTVK